jgi:hypothetical protein
MSEKATPYNEGLEYDAEDLPTNTDHPEHNPRDHATYPRLPNQWYVADLADSVDAGDIDTDRWVDSNGYPYNPEAGSRSPQDGRCNAVLTNYAERYGERRYCGALPMAEIGADVDHGRCNNHAAQAQDATTAEEMLQHGAASKSRDHTYRGLDPWDKLLVHGVHESLLGDSTFDFAPAHELKEFDFTNADIEPRSGHVDGSVYRFSVAHATQHIDRAMALWAAAVDGVKMMNVNAEIAEDAMSVESVEQAQLTSPTEADPTQEFRTIETLKEHPLNLAYSRLARDRKELLQYGGVVVDGATSDDSAVVEGLDALTVVQADSGGDSPMQQMAREANDDPSSDTEFDLSVGDN